MITTDLYGTSQQIPHNNNTDMGQLFWLHPLHFLPSTSSSLTSMYLYSKLQPFSVIPLAFCNLVLEISHNLSISVVFPDVTLPVIQHVNRHRVPNLFILPNTKTVLENDGPTRAELAATSLRIVDLTKSMHTGLIHCGEEKPYCIATYGIVINIFKLDALRELFGILKLYIFT